MISIDIVFNLINFIVFMLIALYCYKNYVERGIKISLAAQEKEKQDQLASYENLKNQKNLLVKQHFQEIFRYSCRPVRQCCLVQALAL